MFLALCLMKAYTLRIRTWFAVSISHDVKRSNTKAPYGFQHTHTPTHTHTHTHSLSLSQSLSLSFNIYIYIYIYIWFSAHTHILSLCFSQYRYIYIWLVVFIRHVLENSFMLMCKIYICIIIMYYDHYNYETSRLYFCSFVISYCLHLWYIFMQMID